MGVEGIATSQDQPEPLVEIDKELPLTDESASLEESYEALEHQPSTMACLLFSIKPWQNG